MLLKSCHTRIKDITLAWLGRSALRVSFLQSCDRSVWQVPVLGTGQLAGFVILNGVLNKNSTESLLKQGLMMWYMKGYTCRKQAASKSSVHANDDIVSSIGVLVLEYPNVFLDWCLKPDLEMVEKISVQEWTKKGELFAALASELTAERRRE